MLPFSKNPFFSHVRAPNATTEEHPFSVADAEAPKFVGDMQDVAVQEGEKAKFDCYVTGQPTPDVKWYVVLTTNCVVPDDL